MLKRPAAFCFGSEIQPLFALDPRLSREPDYRGIDHFLTFHTFRALRVLPRQKTAAGRTRWSCVRRVERCSVTGT